MAATLEQFHKSLGSRIAAIREQRVMTQTELARQVQLSRTSITNIERGVQKLSLYKAIQIASALRIQIHELIPDAQSSGEIINKVNRLPAIQGSFVLRSLVSPVDSSRSAR